jgi:hypothetical protein
VKVKEKEKEGCKEVRRVRYGRGGVCVREEAGNGQE